MKRRYTVFAVVLAVSILIGIQAVEVVNANPVPWPKLPNTDLPTVQIAVPDRPVSLRDNSTAVFNVTVTRPDSWNSYYMGFLPIIGDWGGMVYLDGLRIFPLPPQHESLTSPLPASVSLYHISFTGYPDTSLTINGINRKWGNLTYNGDLEIRIDAITYSEIGQLNRTNTQTVSFAIDPNSQTITFSKGLLETINGTASAPTVIINPTTNPTQSIPTINTGAALPVELNPSILAIAIVIVAFASILLVYFKRKRGKYET